MRKNEAKLSHKDESFIVWQDSKLSWFFSYRNLENVNTGHHELQPALNVIYESIEDKTRYSSKKTTEWKTPHKLTKSANIFDRL